MEWRILHEILMHLFTVIHNPCTVFLPSPKVRFLFIQMQTTSEKLILRKNWFYRIDNNELIYLVTGEARVCDCFNDHSCIIVLIWMTFTIEFYIEHDATVGTHRNLQELNKLWNRLVSEKSLFTFGRRRRIWKWFILGRKSVPTISAVCSSRFLPRMCRTLQWGKQVNLYITNKLIFVTELICTPNFSLVRFSNCGFSLKSSSSREHFWNKDSYHHHYNNCLHHSSTQYSGGGWGV